MAQGRLEIPCVLKFVASNRKEATKAKCLLESALSIEEESIIVTVSPANIDIPQILSSTADNINNETTLINDKRVEKAKDDVIEETVDLTKSCNIDSPPAKKQKCFDVEKVIMGEELTDFEINYAQRLLKVKHPRVNGLRTTLYQGKMQEAKNSVQVIYCPSRFHWITVTTMNCKADEVRVFDSMFTHCDKQTTAIINNLYRSGSEKLTITMCRCQKQVGSKDCGLFSLAFAVALIFNLNPSKLKFRQQKMRSHLVECFTKQVMMPFPYK